MFSFVRSAALLATAVLCLGCNTRPTSNYNSLNLIKASGTITLDGAPLEGAVVSFDDAEDGTFSYGLTNANGQFQLRLDSQMMGVKPGTKIIRISTTRKVLGLNSSEEADPAEKSAEPEKVPAKFNKKSKLFVEVTADQTSYDFDLKSE